MRKVYWGWGREVDDSSRGENARRILEEGDTVKVELLEKGKERERVAGIAL